MSNSGLPSFVKDAHRFFSAHCFNEAWKWMDLPERTPEQELEMLLCSMASFWHWTQREDVNAEKRSIACWQVSRVYCLMGNGAEANRFADLCLKESEADGVDVFYLAYAFEAKARAQKTIGDLAGMEFFKSKAEELTAKVENPEYRSWISADLLTV